MPFFNLYYFIWRSIKIHFDWSNTKEGTFQSKDPVVRVHQGRISSDRAAKRLHRHAHVHNDHTVLRSCLTDANILLWLHRNVCECDELLIYSQAWQLHQKIWKTFISSWTPSNNHNSLKDEYLWLSEKSNQHNLKGFSVYSYMEHQN